MVFIDKSGMHSIQDSVPDPAAADAYRNGMRWLAAGVCLITSTCEGEWGGMIATAVTSVSTEPPTLLVCVNRNASLFQVIQESGAFCVNVLGVGSSAVVDMFSSTARRAERFQAGSWSQLASGVPMCGEALVGFDCRVAKVVDWHTHAIFIGEVRGVFHPQSSTQPLLYMDRRFHHLSELPAPEE